MSDQCRHEFFIPFSEETLKCSHCDEVWVLSEAAQFISRLQITVAKQGETIKRLEKKWAHVFAGYTVFENLTDIAKLFVSPEAVSETLDALNRASKIAPPKQSIPEEQSDIVEMSGKIIGGEYVQD